MAEGWRVTPRDVMWLEWIGRWRGVTAALIADYFTVRGQQIADADPALWSAPVKKVERRLRGMREIGLVESASFLANEPRLHWLTREGMKLVGLEGAVSEPKLSQVRHDLTVVRVANSLTVDKPNHRLITEREIRRSETPNRFDNASAHYSISLPERASRYSRVWPDLVSVTPSGKLFAHEIETSRKDHRRLVRLMLSYGHAEQYEGALYYADEPVLRTVQRAAQEANETATERGQGRPIMVVQWQTK